MRYLDLLRVLSLPIFGAACYAATFGTAIPVRGTVSDLALDESRGRLYLANFSAGWIDIMNTGNLSFGSPLILPEPPGAIALVPE